ncbi:MAG: DUF1949 domain-containing protein [Thalassolituus maritimus]|uniref:Uncharacterized protein, YigZ family n=1 Tax=Thalassolituus maritimus TaxID=484498 RepID=A0A1N7Q047_9GAMM|nr:YigZ family protein [Thalassolituus maritimus]TPD55731.1 MAG: DUF1949 domain-containing protein [Thalassolituus maritimus]SIT16059.1 uncharacterized protein, YigZ family [Thalassolituus maritimus]
MPVFPLTSFTYETEVKNSRFIAEVLPVTDPEAIRLRQQMLKGAHPKANHVCYGFRVMNAEGQVSEGFSDDGEPGGTSGPPILRVMQHHNLINCAILITRYFGGIKLGMGGLQRAYSSSASDAIINSQQDNWVEWRPVKSLCLKCDFRNEAQARYIAGEAGASIDKEEYSATGVSLTLSVTEDQEASLRSHPDARLFEIASGAS